MKVKNAEITKNFVASTGHVKQDDMKLLEAEVEQKRNLVVYTFNYGVMVYCGAGIPLNDQGFILTLQGLGFSNEFLKLMVITQNHDCSWLHLDQDGEVYPELKYFDW